MQRPNYVYVRLAHDQVEAWTEGQLSKAAAAGKAPEGTLYKYVLTTERFRMETVARIVPVVEAEKDDDEKGGSAAPAAASVQAELPIKEGV